MRTAILLTALAAMASAGEVRVNDRLFPLVRDGAGWTTSILLVNLSAAPTPYELVFRTNEAGLWAMPVEAPGAKVEGAYVRGLLAPGARLTVKTKGTGDASRSGYALVFIPGESRLGGRLSVRKPSGEPFLDLPVVADREDRLTLPFDLTGGARTSILWLSETLFTLVAITLRDEDGSILDHDQFQFNASSPLSQDLFSLAGRYPQLAGKRGTITLEVTYPMAGIYDDRFFSALALQTDADGNMVPVTSMATSAWVSAPY